MKPGEHTREIEETNARRDAERALRESEERFRMAFESSGTGIVFVGLDGRCVRVNPRACDIVGCTEAELQERRFEEILHPEDRAAEAALVRELLAGTRRFSQMEKRCVRRDGRVVWVRLTVALVRDVAGAPLQFVTQIEDITERKQLEDSLARARDQAVENSRLKSDFLASVSHEIRTPMNGIIGMTHLMLESELSPAQREMARVIQSSSESLLGLINDLLDLSKIESGKLRVEVSEFELQPVIEEVRALLAPRAKEKSLALTCDFGPRLGHVFLGDAGRVRQVLLNLVSNAIKFTDQGSVQLEARCMSVTARTTRLRVAVRDTGPGIPPEAHARLFQSFTQLEGSGARRHDGAGLGLAISRQIVELMGGTIGFQSAPGGGSTFWFELPLERRVETRLPEPGVALPPGLRVLVVRAPGEGREALLGQLRQAGIEAAVSDDGVAALARLQEGAAAGAPWHVTIVAAQLPGMTGLQFAVELRAEEQLGVTQIALLSAAHAPENPAMATAAGIESILTEPLTETQLRRCLARLGARAEAVAAGMRVATPLVPATTAGPALRVLLAEDNPANQTVAQMLLAKLGHAVDVANNGSEALARLARTPYDAVLMDCQMPVLDGYEATRRIRAGLEPGINPTVPVIALTAYAMPDDRRKCLDAGMNDYVTKPVRLRDLRDALVRCGLAAPRPDSPVPWGEPAGGPAPEARLAEVLDLEVLQRMRALRGREAESLLPELVQLFAREAPQRLAELLRLAQAHDRGEVERVAHAFAGSCASVGAARMQTITLAIEQHARRDAWDEVARSLRELAAAWSQTDPALRTHSVSGA